MYFNREQLERLVQAFADVRAPAFERVQHADAKMTALETETEERASLLAAAESSGYRVEGLREFLDSRSADMEA